jgi:WD40 repeat protein
VLPAGKRLGPYEIVSLISTGGMGVIYRAQDPRLGRDVVLKVIREELVLDGGQLRRFEREARAAASLNHPNLLTVHDVGRDHGVAYIVTELLEGENLRSILSRRFPAPSQALSYAAQAARGLAAAHGKGVIHRDLKPENLFLTADGRVKILDFGLAHLVGVARAECQAQDTATELPTPSGVLIGTVAYMSPEQARGIALDVRSDIFSLGVVLFELLSHCHPFRRETVAATLTAILEDTPPALTSLDPEISPVLDGIVRRCLEKDKEQRFHSAHDLACALEAVGDARSCSGAARDVEERSPYPGLASFTERDTGVFFGREVEVEALWRRLETRRLVAVIGPSGVGKTSLVRAGVIASRPAGWGALLFTPGAAPQRNLGEALAPELAGDPNALRRLLSFEETEVAVDLVRRWRRSHAEALLVVDQFEELFTLNARESQEAFVNLLGRLAREGDVHVLLSMRDDFLIRCAEHEDLAPVFESLIPLAELGTSGQRRALVEPAGRRGYRFEDNALVEEMIHSVEGSRGALPLLAFAVARLWEMRDREEKLLTRRTYDDIGGVAGALAQHAEAAMERIGPERQAVARELFRNLVTAEGTRAAADSHELLSLFPKRDDTGMVLDELIDARLLTSFELKGAGEQPARQRVELVHESLLRAWPRLVRWRAQDEEGAVLRDQLKKASRLWDEKGRTRDLLWTGTAQREFELWRQRYSGALTALEEHFVRAMADQARRRRRLKTAAVASVIVVLASVAIAIGISRHQAAKARDQAQAEALRAEAGKLLALARIELDRYPTSALAYARKSLELADTNEARRFAVEVLWRAPVARVLPVDRVKVQLGIPDRVFFNRTALSPDGRWLAIRSPGGYVMLFPADGRPPLALPPPEDAGPAVLTFSPEGDQLVTGGPGQRLRLLSLPDLQEIRRIELGGVRSWGGDQGGSLVTFTRLSAGDAKPLIRSWSPAGGGLRTLGRAESASAYSIDVPGRRIAYARGRSLLLRDLGPPTSSPERIVGEHDAAIAGVEFLGNGDWIVSTDDSGEIRLWSASGRIRRILEGPVEYARYPVAIDRKGRRMAVNALNASADVWDLDDPPDAEPIHLERPEPHQGLSFAFDSGGAWLATNNTINVALWPLAGPRRRTLRRHGGLTMSTLSFSPDGRWLASCTGIDPASRARLFPLDPEDRTMRTLDRAGACTALRFDPAGERVLVGNWQGRLLVAPTAGGSPHRLETGWKGAVQAAVALAFDASGRRAAASPYDMNPSIRDPKLRVLRVWDLPSGQGRTYSLAHLTDESWWGFDTLRFGPDGSVLAAGAGAGGVVRLILPTNESGTVSSETLYAAGASGFDLSADGRKMLVWASRTPGTDRFEELLVLDLVDHTKRRIETHGRSLWIGAIDASGRAIVTGDIDGTVRVGPISGEEPHLLLGGHTGVVWSVAISPDGRWIASVGDEAIQLWPTPDVTKPPLHTLPHEELMAKLDALTNLRVVHDPTAATGWKLDVGPFPGWKDVPHW